MLRFLASILTVLLSSFVWAGSKATFDVTLSPAGDFTGKVGKIVGFATAAGGKVTASEIKVPLKDLTTGIDLRDKHTKEHLEVEKHPFAILTNAEGEGGKGKGTLEIKGVKKEVSGRYEKDGDELKATFKIKLSDFGITGISYKGIGVDDEVVVNVEVPLKVIKDIESKPKKNKKSKKKPS